jgi:SagB-type dehydrogenase family enzyme
VSRRGATLSTRSRLAGFSTMLGLACALAGAAADTLPLPAPDTRGSVPLERALAGRRSQREFAAAPLSRGQLAQLLWAAQGRTDARGHRTAPSAGAQYPLRLWLVAGDVAGLDPGIYGVATDAGSLLAPASASARGDRRPAVADAALGQAWLRQAPALIVVAAEARATRARYGERADRFVAIEAGAAAQNLLLQAQALGLGGTMVGAFDEPRLRAALGLPALQQPLLIVPVGRPAGG